jgi:hypothetical protein|nr:MAG TPA: hypothetical protein [Herelleviridae sp.]
MATMFIGKNIRRRVVKPINNSVKNRNYVEETTNEEEVVSTTSIVEEVVDDYSNKKENKKQKKSKDMVDENKLTQLESIANGEAPNSKVKVEKNNKGLYERTENSTILLTEDNKMLLND